jgi:hypothetical protein
MGVLKRIPQRPDLNHTPQLNPSTADGSSIPDQTTEVIVKDGHLERPETAAVYSVKRHFLSVGLVLLTGNIREL